MGVDALVANGFSQASHLAFQTSGAAQRLVAAAVAVLRDYKPEWPKDAIRFAEVGISQSGGFSSEAKPITFPPGREPQFPATPDLGEINNLSVSFGAEKPKITLPNFQYRTIAEIPSFAEPLPSIDTRITFPTAPDIHYPDKPALMPVMADFDMDVSVSVPPLNPKAPDYQNQFEDEFYRAFSQGQSRIPATDEAQVWLDRFYPNLMRTYATLTQRINDVLEGRASALGDNFDTHSYNQALRRIEAEREAKQRALSDFGKAGGWGLPDGAWIAGQMDIATEASKARNAAALETYTKRAERELQHLQFVMDLASRLHQAGLDFFRQMAGHGLEAFKAALGFAETAVRFAHAVYELRQKDFEIRARLVGLEVEVFEALLKSQMAKLEVLKTQMELAQLQATLNEQRISQYAAELKAEETKANLYASRIHALELELKARKFPLDLYLGKVQAYEALSNAKRSEYGLLQAEIEGDKAKMEGELSKLKIYETEARVFESEVNARSKQIDVQVRRNDQLLEQFKTLVQAELTKVQADTSRSEQALHAYEATAKVFLAENEAKLQERKFTYDQGLENAKLALEQLRFKFEKQLKLLDAELMRVKAVSDIQMSAAHVDGEMASSAMSAMNAIVSAEIQG